MGAGRACCGAGRPGQGKPGPLACPSRAPVTQIRACRLGAYASCCVPACFRTQAGAAQFSMGAWVPVTPPRPREAGLGLPLILSRACLGGSGAEEEADLPQVHLPRRGPGPTTGHVLVRGNPARGGRGKGPCGRTPSVDGWWECVAAKRNLETLRFDFDVIGTCSVDTSMFGNVNVCSSRVLTVPSSGQRLGVRAGVC